jgi:hypothetical protein
MASSAWVGHSKVSTIQRVGAGGPYQTVEVRIVNGTVWTQKETALRTPAREHLIGARQHLSRKRHDRQGYQDPYQSHGQSFQASAMSFVRLPDIESDSRRTADKELSETSDAILEGSTSTTCNLPRNGLSDRLDITTRAGSSRELVVLDIEVNEQPSTQRAGFSSTDNFIAEVRISSGTSPVVKTSQVPPSSE